ncbi:MAG: TRAP transporter TatT component family protein [bacterium]
MPKLDRFVILVLAAALLPGCIKSMAVNALGDALSEPGGSFGRDDDPDFVCESSPFGLKTIESLLDAEPEHAGLHVAATRGFVQYGYACLQLAADRVEERDYEAAKHLRARAQGMYRRAVRYGLAGMNLVLESKDPRAALRADTDKALRRFEGEHVDLLYWTALAWAAGVSLDKDDIELAADLGLVEPMMRRVEALAPNYEEGSIHDFFMTWEAAKPGGDPQVVEERLAKALAASNDERLAPLVSYAEGPLVQRQDAAAFDATLDRVLAFDLDRAPRHRLVNILAQRRAAWLKARRDDLFL